MPENGDRVQKLPNTRFYSVSANRKLIFLQKISIPACPPCANTPWETTRLVRRLVKLDPVERNPDCDIVPPLRHTIQIGVRHLNQAAPAPGTTDTAYSYLPDGSLAGRLSRPCLDQLRAQYEHAKSADPAPPQ